MISRRAAARSAAGLAGILALGRPPAFAQAAPKKLVYAHSNPLTESRAAALDWMCNEVTRRSGGELLLDCQAGTRLNKELEVMNAVKAGAVAMGDPAGSAGTVFPEMAILSVPYLIGGYEQSYRLLNGAFGQRLDQTFQQEYGLKVLFFFDYGFRHLWNTRQPIDGPRDLRGMRLRVQQAKIYGDTVNGLGGTAVPMPWAEVTTAAREGLIDGADLPVINMTPLRAYEVSKYYSLTGHNYTPTVSVMNLAAWNGLTPAQQKLFIDTGMETQAMLRKAMESVDTLAAAKAQLEPRGMAVNQPDHAPFRKVAEESIWPRYKGVNPELWDLVMATPA
jgi:tripartite ATP-independent transporter DctP family solute receptor